MIGFKGVKINKIGAPYNWPHIVDRKLNSEPQKLEINMKNKPNNMGRPVGEPKRQVRLRWPLKVADWIERNRDKILKLGKKG